MAFQALRQAIDFGEQVLNGPHTPDEEIERVTNYVRAVGVVLDQLKLESLSEGDQKLLVSLAEMHPRIVKVTENLMGATSQALMDLQSRGKAILKYTDTMPKSVSVRPKTKT
jgi:hypothetical protein